MAVSFTVAGVGEAAARLWSALAAVAIAAVTARLGFILGGARVALLGRPHRHPPTSACTSMAGS